MRRFRLVVFAIALAVAVLAPQSASAAGVGPPLRFPAGAFVGTFPAGLFCTFPVFTQPVPINRTQTVSVFFDSAGNVKKVTVTGVQYDLLQNTLTGKSIVVNSSGYGVDVFEPDGSIRGSGGGPGLFGLSSVEGGATVHGPGLFLIEGQTTFTVTAPTADGQTFIEDLVAHGRVTSLCPVLAS